MVIIQMPLVQLLYFALLTIVSAIGLIRYSKLTQPIRILACSVPAILFWNIVCKILALKFHNNAPGMHLLSITEFVFYTVIYYSLFKKRTVKYAIAVIIVVGIVFFIINLLFLQPFNRVFPTNIYLPTEIIFTALSLMFFRQMLLYPTKINIVRQSVFWFNTAMLFYATTMFFNLGMTNYYSTQEWSNYIYYFWYFIMYVFHILVAVAILADDKHITNVP